MRKRFLPTFTLLLLITACHKETKVERYTRDARETTAQCPMAIDSNTTLDSMTYSAIDHRFTYYYNVQGIEDSVLKSQEPNFRSQILDRLLNTTDMIPYVQDGISFRYVYRTKASGNPIMDIELKHPLKEKAEFNK